MNSLPRFYILFGVTALLLIIVATGLTSAAKPGKPPLSLSRVPESAMPWLVHAFGLVSELVGVFLSMWLTRTAGLLPERFQRQILGISVAIAIVSYAGGRYAVADAVPSLSPQFAFQAIKDGFAWSTSLPLFAKALGQGSPATTL